MMNKADINKASHWSFWYLLLMYCVVMNILMGGVFALWATVAMGKLAQFPMTLIAYIFGMFTLSAILPGIFAVAAHLLIRYLTKSLILTVIAVTLLTTLAELLRIREYVPSLNSAMHKVLMFAPFVATVASIIVWRESSAASE